MTFFLCSCSSLLFSSALHFIFIFRVFVWAQGTKRKWSWYQLHSVAAAMPVAWLPKVNYVLIISFSLPSSFFSLCKPVKSRIFYFLHYRLHGRQALALICLQVAQYITWRVIWRSRIKFPVPRAQLVLSIPSFLVQSWKLLGMHFLIARPTAPVQSLVNWSVAVRSKAHVDI